MGLGGVGGGWAGGWFLRICQRDGAREGNGHGGMYVGHFVSWAVVWSLAAGLELLCSNFGVRWIGREMGRSIDGAMVLNHCSRSAFVLARDLKTKMGDVLG